MGLDLGARRIGVAISDELGIVATPVGYVTAGAGEQGQLAALVKTHGITGLVVGIPRTMSGAEGPQAKEVRTAAGNLAGALDLPLAFWDERLTTVIAERSLISGGRSRQQRREEIDAVAAAVMLQGYLDRRAVQLRTAGAGDSAILGEVTHPDDRDGE
jgi:putative Holliday junction resolvase